MSDSSILFACEVAEFCSSCNTMWKIIIGSFNVFINSLFPLEHVRNYFGSLSGIYIGKNQIIWFIKKYLNTLLSKPCPYKAFLLIFTRIIILEDVTFSTVELWLIRDWKKNLLLAIYSPNLWMNQQKKV